MQAVSTGFLNARSRGGLRVKRAYLSTSYGDWVEVPHTEYSIEAARGERVVARYSGSVTLPPSVDPSSVDEYATRVQVRAGFVTNGLEQLVTIGTLTVYDIEQDYQGKLILSGFSVEKAVDDAKFRAPYVLRSSQSVSALTQLLAVAPVPVTVLTTSNPAVPVAVYDEDRWQAVSDIATAMSVDVAADPFGGFTVSDVPTLDNAAAVFATAGTIPGWGEKRTRDGVYSVVVVVGDQTPSGTIPRGVWVDDNPSSPTFLGGPFGEVTARITNPLMLTDAQCRAAARTIGLASQGLARSLSLSGLPADFLEPGDVVSVTRPDTKRDELHIVDGLTHSSSGTQPLRTRTTQAV